MPEAGRQFLANPIGAEYAGSLAAVDIALPNAAALSMPAAHIKHAEIISETIQNEIRRLLRAAVGLGTLLDRTHAGLAHNQLHLPGETGKRIVLARGTISALEPSIVVKGQPFTVLVNPELRLPPGERKLVSDERCISEPFIFTQRRRARVLWASGYSQAGLFVDYTELKGDTAVGLQHDVDHLDGVRYSAGRGRKRSWTSGGADGSCGFVDMNDADYAAYIDEPYDCLAPTELRSAHQKGYNAILARLNNVTRQRS